MLEQLSIHKKARMYELPRRIPGVKMLLALAPEGLASTIPCL
jgi:hypothetical protein